MTRWLGCGMVVLAACTNAASLGVGATLDGDGRVGLEADGSVGGGETHVISTDAGGYPIAARALMFGLELALGGTFGTPHVACKAQLFVEYLRVGAPTGYHARLSFGGMPVHLHDGAAVLAFTAGPLRTTSRHDQESGDQFLYEIATAWSLDASIRLRLPQPAAAPLARWQLALLATRSQLNVTADPD